MVVIVLVALAFAIILLVVRALLKRGAEDDFVAGDEPDETGRGGSTPLPFEPKPPDVRVDFSELAPNDAVDIATASGSRYRFTLNDGLDPTFSVDVLQSDGDSLSFQAIVTGSVRQTAVFPGTFAKGCNIHMYVVKGKDLAPKRTTLVTDVRHASGRNKLN